MVAAAHPLAVEAGLEVLRRGGTAIDAAVAVQMMLGVVEPQASGLGGGGFLLYYDAATRGITVYDGRETAPAGATPTMFLDRGRQAAAVPRGGAPRACRSACRARWRCSSWRTRSTASCRGPICSPRRSRRRARAFRCRRGSPHWLDTMKRFARRARRRARSITTPTAAPKKAGERIVNPALADTMQRDRRARARSVLREGPIAEEMVARVHGHVRPGTLALADLADYKPIKREPLCGPYRVWIVCGMPPPSSGGIAILQMLGLLEPFDLAKDKPNDLRSLHLIAEASRLAFADRARYVADPAFVPVPTHGLHRAGLHRRTPQADVARIAAWARRASRCAPGYVEHGTSHMTIVDRDGNAVAFTTTIEALVRRADDGAAASSSTTS